jgi:DNA repair protein RadA/Sms
VREGTVVFGEIGLSGEVRPVARAGARLKEAAKLGFNQAIAPPATRRAGTGGGGGEISRHDITRVDELLDLLAPAARQSEA